MSVTKILLRHNSNAVVELPSADSTGCCEPLFFKNKLYIRSQKAEELVDPGAYNTDEEWDAAVAQYRLNHPDGEPVFIGPYEHPVRNPNILGVNVQESINAETGISTVEAVSGVPTVSNLKRTFRALSGVVINRSLGHVVTADAKFSIEVSESVNNPTGGVWVNRQSSFFSDKVNLFKITDLGGSLDVGFRELGHGFIDANGVVLPNSEYTYHDDQNDMTHVVSYDYSVGNGDCIVVTDADFSTTVPTPNYTEFPHQHNPSYNHMAVRSKLAFNTSETNKYLCQNGTWKTPDTGVNVAAAPGDTTVKGVVAGSVEIDNVKTEFTVQPANSNMSMNSGYYYTGQGVVRPLGTTTGVLDRGGEKVFYNSDSSNLLDQIGGRLLCNPKAGDEWCAIPVYVDYHTIPDTGRVEAVPYILLPVELLTGVLSYWSSARTYPGNYTEGNKIEGQPAYHSSNQQNNE